MRTVWMRRYAARRDQPQSARLPRPPYVDRLVHGVRPLLTATRQTG